MGSKVISDMVTALKGLAVYLVRKNILHCRSYTKVKTEYLPP